MKGSRASQGRRPAATDQAPVPRRLGRPKWLDLRILAGLLLVVAAVVIGARVVGASSRTAPVWSAGHDLAAGTVLNAADVVAVQVNLADAAVKYLAAEPGLVVGKALTIPLREGELLPVSALNVPTPGRVVVVPVAAERMPPGVAHGSRVDIYLSATASGAAGQTTTQLAKNVTVQSATSPSGGALSGASSTVQLAVLVDPALAEEMVRKLPSGQAIITLVTG